MIRRVTEEECPLGGFLGRLGPISSYTPYLPPPLRPPPSPHATPQDMQPLITEAARLSDGVGLWDRLSLETAHIRDMAALAKQEGEEEVREECEERMAGLEKECEALRTQVGWEVERQGSRETWRKGGREGSKSERGKIR